MWWNWKVCVARSWLLSSENVSRTNDKKRANDELSGKNVVTQGYVSNRIEWLGQFFFPRLCPSSSSPSLGMTDVSCSERWSLHDRLLHASAAVGAKQMKWEKTRKRRSSSVAFRRPRWLGRSVGWLDRATCPHHFPNRSINNGFS